MPVTNLTDLHRLANHTLRETITNERAKKWTQVVKGYRRLLAMLNSKNLPPDLDLPNWYPKLMYELHFHLGMALQRVNDHKKAANQYSLAIEAVAIPKNGCTAGCHSNSCLMTPLYARRAYAQAAVGDSLYALRDAEKAVMLDNQNPDVYCVRAMVRNSANKEDEAMRDVQDALQHNPKHPCALMLHGTLSTKSKTTLANIHNIRPANRKINSMHPSHTKACSINPDCYNYLDVDNFKKREACEFYERFLYSLNVPHTMAEIPNLAPYLKRTTRPPSGYNSHFSTRPPSGKSVYSEPVRPFSGKSFGGDSVFSTKTTNSRYYDECGYPTTSEPSDEHAANFRCGTPKPPRSDVTSVVRRRREYGEAIRDHLARPRTADNTQALIERPVRNSRVQSASTHRTAVSCSNPSQEIPVFTMVNVKDAPRMYYKPWKGDRLPVTIRQNSPSLIPFKV